MTVKRQGVNLVFRLYYLLKKGTVFTVPSIIVNPNVDDNKPFEDKGNI